MPVSRLRHWCSSRSLRISPLLREFRLPLTYSRNTVSSAVPRLSPGISHLTCISAYTPFTPSHSGQRSDHTYYRGCWHVFSRSLLWRYRQTTALPVAVLPSLQSFTTYKAFFTHAASLRQGFPHCAIFTTAASRRSLGRVSVPVWLIILSDQLPVFALVGSYPAN